MSTKHPRQAPPKIAIAPEGEPKYEQPPLCILLLTYFGYFIAIVWGHVRDFFEFRLFPNAFKHLVERDGLAPLAADFETFYTRRLYTRIRDCWNRPATGHIGRTIKLMERVSTDCNKTFQFTGKTLEVLNLSSYNYLGFAENDGPCAAYARQAIEHMNVGMQGARSEAGTLTMHKTIERMVAKYLNKEAALIFSMGFSTNSANLPALGGPGTLVLSDKLNHASLTFGMKLTEGALRVFPHGDMRALEAMLRYEIAYGMERTRRPWKRIIVLVEGLYSMEGTFCDLQTLVALKRKYKFYLFVDEAHSIGALGATGRGLSELMDVDRAEIDILMGTFTKSFGATGGYIAGSQELIDLLRVRGDGHLDTEAMTPVVCAQIISSMCVICPDLSKIVEKSDLPLKATWKELPFGYQTGTDRIAQLEQNALYFRGKLREMGFIVYGDDGSPVVPLLIYTPGRISALSRECLKRGIAIVVVGYPATNLIDARARFCLSAAHTKDDLDYALSVLDEVGDLLLLKMSNRSGHKVKSLKEE